MGTCTHTQNRELETGKISQSSRPTSEIEIRLI